MATTQHRSASELIWEAAQKARHGKAPKPRPKGRANGAVDHEPPAPEPEPPPHVETFTAADLMQMDLPEQRWAVEGVLPDGCSILAGKPKLGKSWLALNIAHAVAVGGMALGNIPVDEGDVLYLALEDTKRRLKNRLIKILGSQQAKPPARLTLTTSCPRANEGGLAFVNEWLSTHTKARLIIIDTWAKFKPLRIVKTNEYEADYADASQVKALADQHGVAVLFLHHCRKMAASDPLEEVSGTLGLTGAVDSIIVLRRERGQHDATLHVTGRDVEEQELALQWSAEYGLWSIIGQAEEYRVSAERQKAIDVLRKAGKPMTPSEVAPLIGKTVNATKKLLWRSAEEGQVKSLGEGKYTTNEELGEPRNQGNQRNQGNPMVPCGSSGSESTGNREYDSHLMFP